MKWDTFRSWFRKTVALATAAGAISAGLCRPAAGTDQGPHGIAYDVRIEQQAKGNLAPNPSFERVSPSDGTGEPDGWQRIGVHVEWVNRKAGAEADEVRHGDRSIKIERRAAGELDEAEGVMSDFIPVIPGTYNLTCELRLAHVDPHRRRWGGRLGDAITMKVFFFDAEKSALDPRGENPVGGSLIDTSDKSHTFANYWSIDEFPWSTVHARTYNYPFAEGDLPTRTRFVRLFFGLKGSGTLWLDNVVFRYSKWNFSALERMQPHIGRPLPPLEALIPTPKAISSFREVTYLEPGRTKGPPPLIVLPASPAPAERTAARLLAEKLNAALAPARSAGTSPPVTARIVAEDADAVVLQHTRLVFSVGDTRLRRRLSPELPPAAFGGNPQGYVVAPVEAGGCHVVFLVGESALGSFYAAATAAQLLERERCVYHSAAVVDHPDFLGRSFLLTRWGRLADLDRDLEGLDLMSRHKLNKAYAGTGGRTKSWYQPDALYKAGIAETGQWCRENGVFSLGIMVNPYAHFDFEPAEEGLSDQARTLYTHADPAGEKTLQSLFALGLEAGAGTVMLLADDFVPHTGRNRKNFSLYTPEDRRRFLNLQNAHAHVIGRLKTWVDRHYPGTRFEFCPPWYANEFIDRSEGKAEVYLRELAAQIPAEVALIWTGPTVRSLTVDMADFMRYRDLIGRPPMFWDNTLYARNIETTVYGGYTTYYPDKVDRCNLFEPLDGERPADFHALNHGRHLYVNGTADSEIYRIKFATVADYAWNTAAYDPERSLWKALVKAYGPASAREVLLFNAAYYGLYEVCMRLERGEPGREDWVLAGAARLARLDQSLLALREQLPQHHPLIGELEGYRDRQRQRLEGLSGANPHPN